MPGARVGLKTRKFEKALILYLTKMEKVWAREYVLKYRIIKKEKKENVKKERNMWIYSIKKSKKKLKLGNRINNFKKQE